MELSGNIHGEGKTTGYIKGIIDRFGVDRLNWLDGHHDIKKYSCFELIEIRKYYNKLIRENIKYDSDRPY